MQYWTLEEQEYIHNNYDSNNLLEICNKVGRSPGVVGHLFKSLDFLKERDLELKDKFFINQTQETAYLLGFLWADAWISNPDRPSGIGMEILKNDGDEIYPMFLDTCSDWKISYRDRKHRREQATIRISSSEFAFDLSRRGLFSFRKDPSVTLNEIREDLKKYFILGFFDGDGCWYFHLGQNLFQCSFAGKVDQIWDSIIEYIHQESGVKFNPHIQSNGSQIRISSKNRFTQFGKWIYEGHNLGLSRKRNKFYSCIDASPALL